MNIALLPHKREYVRYWQCVVSQPDMLFRLDYGVYKSGDALRRDMWRALDRRISKRGGIAPLNPRQLQREIDEQRDQKRLRDIVTARVRVYAFDSKAVRSRFSHLLADRSEP